MPMSIVYYRGEFVSVAKADCPECHGTGIILSYTLSREGYSTNAVVQFCKCIKIEVPAGRE